jgi:hypothetical protein
MTYWRLVNSLKLVSITSRGTFEADLLNVFRSIPWNHLSCNNNSVRRKFTLRWSYYVIWRCSFPSSCLCLKFSLIHTLCEFVSHLGPSLFSTLQIFQVPIPEEWLWFLNPKLLWLHNPLWFCESPILRVPHYDIKGNKIFAILSLCILVKRGAIAYQNLKLLSYPSLSWCVSCLLAQELLFQHSSYELPMRY